MVQKTSELAMQRAIDLDKILAKLQKAQADETRTMTKLRRAQTLFDKYYSTRVRLQAQIDAARKAATHVSDRLIGQEKER